MKGADTLGKVRKFDTIIPEVIYYIIAGNIVMNFGDILRRLRTEQGIKQKQVAMELQVSESAISNYENGIHYPDLDTLRKLAEYFHVSTDFLLGRTEYRSPIRELGQELTNICARYNIMDVLQELSPESRQSLLQYLTLLKWCE